MRNDRHLAIKLRKQNKSYNKISKELNIPKSTLTYWFKQENWSEEIKKELTRKALYVAKKRLRLVNKARKEKWDKWHKECREQARKQFPLLRRHPLFLAGLMLYWGEGDSKLENSLVRLSNTDPEMIKIFCLFLEESCLISKEKIKAELILYPDLNEEYCKKFWSQVSGIPSNQFIKSQFIQGRHPTKRLSHGICIIYVTSRELKEKIFTWLKLYQDNFRKKYADVI